VAVSSMRNASGHNYWNSSFIMDVDVAMGQIPRSTERISSYSYFFYRIEVGCARNIILTAICTY